MYQNRFITSREFREVRTLNTGNLNNRSGSLRFVVYDFFREQMKKGILIPGISYQCQGDHESLGISMTPLQEAWSPARDGGVQFTVIPRRGVLNVSPEKIGISIPFWGS
jgi:hypothetical protein